MALQERKVEVRAAIKTSHLNRGRRVLVNGLELLGMNFGDRADAALEYGFGSSRLLKR